MKAFIKQIALTACVLFTIFMLLSLPMAFYFAGLSGSDTQGLTITLSLFIGCGGVAFLQGFWFSGLIIKKLAYALRLAGFAVTAAALLFACGWLGNWFPHEIEVVASFLMIFIAIFAIATIGYGIYFKKTAGSYDAALARYRDAHAKDANR